MGKNGLRTAVRDTVPVMTGYLFLGFGFGLLLRQAGYGTPWALAMSLFIYAGSMQFVAVSLLSSGAGLATVALTTLLVNARHLFYGISMVDAYKGAGVIKPYLIFSLTDETYSLVSAGKTPAGVDRLDYCTAVSVLDQCYWVAGTLLGSLAGAAIRVELEGIEFVLTALFVTIFTEQWLSEKDHTPACVGVAVTAASLILFGKDLFLIPAMVLITLGLSGMQTKEGARHE